MVSLEILQSQFSRFSIGMQTALAKLFPLLLGKRIKPARAVARATARGEGESAVVQGLESSRKGGLCLLEKKDPQWLSQKSQKLLDFNP